MTVIDRLTVSLVKGATRCEVAPSAGGAIAGFWWQDGRQRLDWLRGATTAEIAAGDARALAAYPILPYGGRHQGGRFHFCGHDVSTSEEDGHGWRGRWRVAERDDDLLLLDYRHEGEGWPWPYRARQRLALSEDALTVTLELENLGDSVMPAGLGLRLALPGEPALLPSPLPDFADWDGRAELRWSRRQATLAIEAEQPILGFLRVERGEDGIAALAPVSQCADAVNRARAGAAGTGLRVLAPGASRSATVTLRAVGL